MKWFNDCHSLEEVKATYKKLAKQYHPDLGGDTATMQEINKEYAFTTAQTVKGENLTSEEAESEILSSELYRKAIEQIVHLEGLVIELVGYWIWVTGDTYRMRYQLKSAGFLFAPKKMAWYFRTAEYQAKRSSGKSLDEIKSKYGSETIKENNAGRKARRFID